MNGEQIVERTREEIAEYIPDSREATIEHSMVNRIPMAIHCPSPGTERRRAPIDAPIDNLKLAGDRVKTKLPSSMESAAKSGWLSAESILRESGRALNWRSPRSRWRVLPASSIGWLTTSRPSGLTSGFGVRSTPCWKDRRHSFMRSSTGETSSLRSLGGAGIRYKG